MNQRQLNLIQNFEYNREYQISEIAAFEQEFPISLATLKRDLSKLIGNNFLKTVGVRRALKYCLSDFGLLHRKFKNSESQKTKIIKNYNFRLLDILGKEEIFNPDELEILNKATKNFLEKTKEKSETIHKKELERFIIELSWKSSKIEGNTYTLLDTEKLIRDGIESGVNTKEEATMILNHKKSFNYILECKNLNKSIISFRELENIHRLLVEGLGVNHGLRKSAVGITGTTYLPLSQQNQIESEVRKLIEVINSKKDAYSKSLISVLGISYIQPFEDGNKRTSRLFSNAILMFSNSAPLSYRSVDEKEYREAILVFYEQNSLESFKEIFIQQYIFACENYNLG